MKFSKELHVMAEREGAEVMDKEGYMYLLEIHDTLRDIWNRRYLHGKDDGEMAKVRARIRKLMNIKRDSAYV